jgi:hypothetical protein
MEEWVALRKKKNAGLRSNKVIQALIHPRILPFTLTFSCLAVLFVTIRMKSIEQAYLFDSLDSNLNKVLIQNKEIKAQRARMLSVQRLRDFAEKFNLKEPGPEQIILIP